MKEEKCEHRHKYRDPADDNCLLCGKKVFTIEDDPTYKEGRQRTASEIFIKVEKIIKWYPRMDVDKLKANVLEDLERLKQRLECDKK